ncbi:MAG: response regulator [Planctomycetes bacterium]|nr:response regulator [Planctomycetota bacterium]
MTAFRPKKDKRIVDVLVVDDDPNVQELLKEILEQEGMSYDVATDGKDAFGRAMQNEYSLILMDIKMPQWNGLEAIRSLEFCDEFKKVIVVSGYIDDRMKKELEKEPVVVGWFDKPFNPNDLAKLIRQAVPNPVGPRGR